jgi:hypothetical protein
MLSQWGRGSSLAPNREQTTTRLAGLDWVVRPFQAQEPGLDGLSLFSSSVDADARQESMDGPDGRRLSGAAVSGKAFTLNSPSQQKQRRQP